MNVNSRGRAVPDGWAQQPGGKDAMSSALLLIYVLLKEEGKSVEDCIIKIGLYRFSYKSLKKSLSCKSKHLSISSVNRELCSCGSGYPKKISSNFSPLQPRD